MTIRVFDFWVHERDITTPLGLLTDDAIYDVTKWWHVGA
jgi:hypothetical protein